MEDEKNLGGRPPIFETPEEFQEVADEYFAHCETDQITPTVNGLCLVLNMTRETLLRYGEKPGFSDSVRKARMKLEMAWEQKLAGNNVAGAIFWLKNQGWTDTQRTELTGAAGGPIQVSRFRLAPLE